MFISADTGRLLEAAASELNGASPDSDEARLVEIVRSRWEKARRVPTGLAADQARAAARGPEAWVAARSESNCAGFALVK